MKTYKAPVNSVGGGAGHFNPINSKFIPNNSNPETSAERVIRFNWVLNEIYFIPRLVHSIFVKIRPNLELGGGS